MELLWTSLEEWLNLLKEEIDESDDPSNSFKVKLKISPKGSPSRNALKASSRSLDELENLDVAGSGHLNHNMDVSNDSLCEAVFQSQPVNSPLTSR